MSNKLSSALVADMPKRGRDRPLHAPLYWSVALRPSPPACRKGEGRERGVGAIAAALTTACSTHPASHRRPTLAAAAPHHHSAPSAAHVSKMGRERGVEWSLSLLPPRFAGLHCPPPRRWSAVVAREVVEGAASLRSLPACSLAGMKRRVRLTCGAPPFLIIFCV